MADESVVENRTDYVALAAKWAGASEARQQLRVSAQEKVASSSLFDFKLRCAEVEKVIDALWAKASGAA